jgi:putative AlgH/UPF0301 family transcriptional regulator
MHARAADNDAHSAAQRKLQADDFTLARGTNDWHQGRMDLEIAKRVHLFLLSSQQP